MNGRMIQGYINAKALGWDSKFWRFSLKTKDKKVAQKRLKQLFNVMKSDINLNYETELEKIIYNGQPKPVKKKTKKPAVIKDSIENIMAEYVMNFEISDCFNCSKYNRPVPIPDRKPGERLINSRIKLKTNKKTKITKFAEFCHECKHFKDKKLWDTQKSRKNKLDEFFGGVRIKDFDFNLVSGQYKPIQQASTT